MPTTIKEYLVSLGWEIKTADWRKFEDALKRSTLKTEQYAKSMAKDFIVAGGAIVTALAAVGGATVGLLGSVARQDMSYQLLARRMFMTVDATKKMKMATDALGYSIEEIIWGPPELAERYRALIQDQDRMFRYLGSDGGERAFRQIRDIGFQFTRMEVGLKNFAMVLTQDVVKKLTGSGSMEEALVKITGWVDQFQSRIPQLSQQFAAVLVPVLTGMWNVLKWISELDYGRMWASLEAGYQRMKTVIDFVQSGNMAGLLWDKDKSASSNISTLAGTDRDQVIGNAIAAARARGLDPARVLALFDQESGFNPSAIGPAVTNPKSMYYGQRAEGLGQVMPGNAPGKNLLDPDVNMAVSLNMLQRKLQKYGGDWQKALNDYYGTGAPMPGQPTFGQYYAQFQEKYQRYQKEFGGDAMYRPQSYVTDMGGVTVNITQPGATPDQVKKAVVEGIAAHERRRAQNSFVARQGVA